MTLGNVIFASTFLITDIISEIYGKKDAKLAVYLGISTSIAFIILSQWWLQYIPAESDFAMPAMKTIFSNTPRLMLTSMIVYAIVQQFVCGHIINGGNLLKRSLVMKENIYGLETMVQHLYHSF